MKSKKDNRANALTQLLEGIPLWALNIITVVGGAISIVSGIITILDGNHSCVLPWIVITVMIVFGATSVYNFRVRKKAERDLDKVKNEIEGRYDQLSDGFHKLMHQCRDLYFYTTHELSKRSIGVDELRGIYEPRLTNILDCYCNIMNGYTRCKMSACIKIFKYDKSGIDEQNACLMTFSRSTSTNTERREYERNSKILVSENTDFESIANPNNNEVVFFQENLTEYAKTLEGVGQEYKNTNKQWRKYYNATIVAPIRIKRDLVYHDKHDKNKETYELLGFLCIDSLDEGVFSDYDRDVYINSAKAVADAMYPILSLYKKCLTEMNKK